MSAATSTIRRPTVAITSPSPSYQANAPASITLVATASTTTTAIVTKVSFFDDSYDLFHATLFPYEAPVGTGTFDAGSGTVNPTNKYVAVDAAYGTLPTPTRVGYVFDGWWTGPDGAGTQVTEATVVTGFNDRTLYAKWVFATFTVTFDAQGGAVNPASTNVTFGSAYGALPVPVLSGYAFAGWRTGEGGTGQQVTDATTVTVRSDHTLYAAWTANVYTVTFNAHGGRGNPASKSVTFGSAYGTLPLPIRDGYTFAALTRTWSLILNR